MSFCCPETASKFVTREFTQDFSYSFDNLSEHATPELELALLTFAYQESVSFNYAPPTYKNLKYIMQCTQYE